MFNKKLLWCSVLKAFTSNPLIATGNIAISNSHICMLPDSRFFSDSRFFKLFFWAQPIVFQISF